MKRTARAIFWILVYLTLTLAPLILLLVAPGVETRDFWREFAVALGFAGLSLMGLQFIPTARLPFLADTFPLDTLYYFHHRISVFSLMLIVAHPLILGLNAPWVWQLFNLVTAPWRARAGIVSALCLVAVAVTSVWRKAFKLRYEPWRVIHNVFSIGATGLAFWHIFGVNYHLSGMAQRILWISLAVVWTGLVAYVRVIKPLMMKSRPYQIQEIQKERNAAWTLVIEPVGHEGFSFIPGQFAWLTIDRNPFRIQEHPFSLASSAERSGQAAFTVKELGDFTSGIGQLEPGTPVYVDGPHGVFSVDLHEAPGYVFLAGGVGSVPIMSMLRTLADRGDERPLYLFYGNPSWEEVVYREELEALQERLDLKVVHVLESAPEEWDSEVGFDS